MKWLLCAIGLVLLYGCDTPYTGFLGPGDIDGYLESRGDETVCLVDGFDSICIQTIPGARGLQGPQGLQGLKGEDGETIIGPRGEPGQQGEPGNDGAVVYLELVKIVTETEFVRVPVRVPVFVEVPVFVLEVSKTETAYSTPVGEVYVPENAPIVVPDDIEVTPVPTPVQLNLLLRQYLL